MDGKKTKVVSSTPLFFVTRKKDFYCFTNLSLMHRVLGEKHAFPSYSLLTKTVAEKRKTEQEFTMQFSIWKIQVVIANRLKPI